MKHILTPDEMRSADAYSIDTLGIPSIVLMENAARSTSDYIKSAFEIRRMTNPAVIVLCGSGNNGGDGFAVARHLHESSRVRVYWIGSTDKMSPETLINFNILKKLNVEVNHIGSQAALDAIDLEAGCIIDAMIGVGGSEKPHGLALSILKSIKDVNAFNVAVDVPTGLNSATGVAHEDCFRAALTVTMFAVKTGLLLGDGPDVSGTVEIAGLGAPVGIVADFSKIHTLEPSDIALLIPPRVRHSSKFDYGRVAVVAGSKNFPGAAALAANAASASGAGLVFLYTSALHSALAAEVIPGLLHSTGDGCISIDNYQFLMDELNKAGSIVIGPGLGSNEETIELARNLIESMPKDKCLIIDADGLRAIDRGKRYHKNIILTPHSGEFSHLTGLTKEEIELNAATLATEWADKLGCNILLKHVPSIITDGYVSYWNPTGNPGMATGGSGDVLAGIIASLAGQGMPLVMAAAAAAYVHGAAADRFASEYSMMSLRPAHIIDYLKKVLP